jgi:membrane protein YqaA with SNARE-associated domain
MGVDALVILLASTHGELLWIVPPIVTIASLAGAAITYWIGRTAGDAGLSRLVSPRHLERLKARLHHAGAGRLAAAAVLPPPFPLTPFVLTCGALHVDRARFFLVFGLMRLIRFGIEAALARHYGDRLRMAFESAQIQTVLTLLVLVILTAAIASAVMLWHRTRPQPAQI